MKHQWLAYLVVGLLSIGAGVAIAGLPNDVPVDATIVAPTTTDVPEPTVATTPPTTTTDPDTTSETTEPETTQSDTTEPDATDSVPGELGERSEIVVAAANGSNVAGAALRVAAQFEELGYVDVVTLDGSEIVEFTTIYFVDGFEDAALRMADDLQLLADFVAPIEESPAVADLPADTELLAYIGRDRA